MRRMRRLTAGLAVALLGVTLTLPAAAQQLRTLTLSMHPLALTEGNFNNPLVYIYIAAGDPAPPGGLPVRFSWINAANGAVGFVRDLIPAGMIGKHFVVQIPDDNVAEPCSRVIVTLLPYAVKSDLKSHDLYTFDWGEKGKGYDYYFYADNDGANGNPPVVPARCRSPGG